MHQTVDRLEMGINVLYPVITRESKVILRNKLSLCKLGYQNISLISSNSVDPQEPESGNLAESRAT